MSTSRTRRDLWIWLAFLVFFVVTLAWLLSWTVGAQSALSDVQRLKGELHQAKVALIQAQAQLANCTAQAEVTKLTAERAGLEADFRAALKPAEGSVFDWATLRFVAPKEPKP